MKTVNVVFENAFDSVRAAYPSVFSKEDVITLLADLRGQVEEIVANDPVIDNVVEKLKEQVISEIENWDYEDDTDIDIAYGRTLETSFNTDPLVRQIEGVFRDFIK